ncbi:hypothetical protein UFOVP244_113 [uncultured Caudovirales phage]|uniref:Uncharacterized protein n=1 Tax=uncultured Caudovirales phage TaxID=2100421 RepID=A0A6J7WYS7_9CAUD|nr:hypothetical protein UFOVP244_113 [uncultured Caudovirales phage]
MANTTIRQDLDYLKRVLLERDDHPVDGIIAVPTKVLKNLVSEMETKLEEVKFLSRSSKRKDALVMQGLELGRIVTKQRSKDPIDDPVDIDVRVQKTLDALSAAEDLYIDSVMQEYHAMSEKFGLYKEVE